MQPYTATVKLDQNGIIKLASVPFEAGDLVNVLVTPVICKHEASERFPLRNTVYRFDDPLAPAVSPEDWEANQ